MLIANVKSIFGKKGLRCWIVVAIIKEKIQCGIIVFLMVERKDGRLYSIIKFKSNG